MAWDIEAHTNYCLRLSSSSEDSLDIEKAIAN